MAILESGRLVQGEFVARLEAEFAAYIGVGHAIAASSGTAALMLACVACGLSSGDEVVTTPFSFVATANAILFAGARPVFVDVQETDGLLDPALVEAAITPATQAILPVHLYGRPCNMTALSAIAQRHGLAIIEDAAQAHGAAWKGKKTGSFGAGCFSLYATKNVFAGEGGLITTDDPDLARRLRLLRDHGQDGRYNHVALGYNFRLTEIQAALALSGLRHLDENNDRRRHIAAYYSKHLRGVVTPREQPDEHHVFHQYTVRVPGDRDDLVDYLAQREIETAIHYPVIIPDQPYYGALGAWGDFPVARSLAREVLSLPVNPALTDEEVRHVVEAVNTWSDLRAAEGSAGTPGSVKAGKES
jgi:dTDP-4-amino-4,6-dideoxygalactose transaminase